MRDSRLAQIIRSQFWPLTFLSVTLVLTGITIRLLIWPAYQNPSARMYTSKFGYASVLRKTGQPFPVKTACAVEREITGTFLGEGLVQCEPVQVPMIAMAAIKRIHVAEGDRVTKGQLLLELDETRIQLKVAAAKAALETAKAEYERVRVGSVNILLDERPELDRIQLESAEQTAVSEQAILDRYLQLGKKGSISPQKLLEQQMKAKQADVQYRMLKLSTEMAAEGKTNSMRIAEAMIREAEMAWRHRKSQVADYFSYAPASGIVERVLVHEGEYNQDPGRPAMMIASGIWFEAHLDQTSWGQVEVNNRVEIRLSAFQDRTFIGTVDRIKPLVSFSLGGPETNRPIRPLGTGAPEWPATFKVRIQFEKEDDLLIPGLTGFARITNRRKSVCVPRGAVSSTSGNRGIVFVVNPSKNRCEAIDVTTGWSDEDWTEIVHGLSTGDEVVVDGYQVLEPNDEIVCSRPQTDNDLMPEPFKLVQNESNLHRDTTPGSQQE